MPILNKELFHEDIRGLNGDFAKELAIENIEKYIDYDYTAEEVKKLHGAVEDIRDDFDELEAENEKLEERIKKLESKIQMLAKENRQLKTENYAMGNLLDFVVIERGIDIFEGSGLKR